ncbi:MAG: T9SS type A sorting domain-containing protein [bacterium]
MRSFVAAIAGLVGLGALGALCAATSARAFPGPGQQYTVKEDLGVLPGHTYSSARAINASRQITGQSGFGSGGFLWRPPGPMVVLEPSENTRAGTDINDAGQVAGDGFGFTYVNDAFLWTPPGPAVGLDGPPGILFDEYASGINESGDVVGAWEDPPLKPCIWYDGNSPATNIGTLGGTGGFATDINESGAVVGSSYLPGDVIQRGFYWTANGGMQDLGAEVANGSSIARGINDSNRIVGSVTTGGVEHAAYWPGPGQAVVDLGTIAGSTSRANAINNNGTIVGRTTTSAMNNDQRAFRKKSGGSMGSLGTLGGATSEAHDVNANGHIVGEAKLANGDTHAVAWWTYTVPPISCACAMTAPPGPGQYLQVFVAATAALDPRLIDPITVTFGDSEGDDTPVARHPFTGALLARLVDQTGDGLLDLVLDFEKAVLESNGDWTRTTTELWIQGATLDRADGFSGIVPLDPTSVPGGAPVVEASAPHLFAPSPNPVTATTQIAFELPRAGDVDLAIFDTSGRRVATLARGPHERGRSVAAWDRRLADGRLATAGVYFVRLGAASVERVAKLVVLD